MLADSATELATRHLAPVCWGQSWEAPEGAGEKRESNQRSRYRTLAHSELKEPVYPLTPWLDESMSSLCPSSLPLLSFPTPPSPSFPLYPFRPFPHPGNQRLLGVVCIGLASTRNLLSSALTPTQRLCFYVQGFWGDMRGLSPPQQGAPVGLDARCHRLHPP